MKLQSLIWICKVECSFQQCTLNEKERENFSIKSQEKRSKMELCSICGINCTSSALRTLLCAIWIDENGSKWYDYEKIQRKARQGDMMTLMNALRFAWNAKKYMRTHKIKWKKKLRHIKICDICNYRHKHSLSWYKIKYSLLGVCSSCQLSALTLQSLRSQRVENLFLWCSVSDSLIF